MEDYIFIFPEETLETIETLPPIDPAEMDGFINGMIALFGLTMGGLVIFMILLPIITIVSIICITLIILSIINKKKKK